MRHGASNTATLSDEQILEMDSSEDVATNTRAVAREDVREPAREEARGHRPLDDDNAILDGKTRAAAEDLPNGDAKAAEPKAKADTGSTDASEPAWVAGLEAQPEAAAEARRWHAAANDVAALDAAYFSADAGERAGLATRLYESDPAAFREMLAASAQTLAARDPQALAELAQQLGLP